jgi:hypothetical protein
MYDQPVSVFKWTVACQPQGSLGARRLIFKGTATPNLDRHIWIIGGRVTQDQWEAADALLRDWWRRAREGQHAHHEAAKLLRRTHYWLAVPVIVITTAVGTTAFATLASRLTAAQAAWLGALSMLAAVLTAIQTHLRCSEKAEKHKYLGGQYGAIRRRIEAVLSLPRDERGRPREIVDQICGSLDAIGGEGDEVSSRVFRRTLKHLKDKDGQASGEVLPRVRQTPARTGEQTPDVESPLGT